MSDLPIQKIFSNSWAAYAAAHNPSSIQSRAALSIISCKTGALGQNFSRCTECGFLAVRNNSCKNRHCPGCQAMLKEEWIDARRAEVIDGPYFHVVFTVPAELRPLIFANQRSLYTLMHNKSAETLLELSLDKKYLGATPAIIQVLHTWGQEMNYHPHIHCIISGSGLTDTMQLRKCRFPDFMIPVKVMAAVFKGKFMEDLELLYKNNGLLFPGNLSGFINSYEWREFRNTLYEKDWCPYIKETFNGFGNAIEYLGRYTHRIAISNSRIKEVTDTTVTFLARDYRSNTRHETTVTHEEFIRRFIQHVLPKGFQKIRYYGLLANRSKKRLLGIVFRIQNHQRFRSKYSCMELDVKLYEMFRIDIHMCPCCGSRTLISCGRTFTGPADAIT